jgi:hypothetical protein
MFIITKKLGFYDRFKLMIYISEMNNSRYIYCVTNLFFFFNQIKPRLAFLVSDVTLTLT